MSATVLKTPQLLLRPFSFADADALHEMWIERYMRRFLWDDKIILRETVTEIIEASKQTFANNGLGYWMITMKENPAPIGFCGLRYFRFDDPPGGANEIELLYGLAPAYRGKGLATQASAAVLGYGFEQIELTHIYAGADPPNKASFRVMERLGMKLLCRTSIGGLEAVYYIIHRDEFQVGEAPSLLERQP